MLDKRGRAGASRVRFACETGLRLALVQAHAKGGDDGTDATHLLTQLGRVGGASAVFLGMEAMGLTAATPAGAENFELPGQSGRGRKVVILGAGIAGLVSAYELQPRRLGRDRARGARPDRRAGVDRSAAATASSRPAGPTRSATFDRPLSQRRRRAAPVAAPH